MPMVIMAIELIDDSLAESFRSFIFFFSWELHSPNSWIFKHSIVTKNRYNTLLQGKKLYTGSRNIGTLLLLLKGYRQKILSPGGL